MRLFLSFSNTVVMFNLFWVNSLIFWLFFYQFLGVAQAQCCNWTLCNYNVTWAALTEAPSLAAPLTNLNLVNVALALLITFLVNKGQKWSTKPNNMYVGKLECLCIKCIFSLFKVGFFGPQQPIGLQHIVLKSTKMSHHVLLE